MINTCSRRGRKDFLFTKSASWFTDEISLQSLAGNSRRNHIKEFKQTQRATVVCIIDTHNQLMWASCLTETYWLLERLNTHTQRLRLVSVCVLIAPPTGLSGNNTFCWFPAMWSSTVSSAEQLLISDGKITKTCTEAHDEMSLTKWTDTRYVTTQHPLMSTRVVKSPPDQVWIRKYMCRLKELSVTLHLLLFNP